MTKKMKLTALGALLLYSSTAMSGGLGILPSIALGIPPILPGLTPGLSIDTKFNFGFTVGLDSRTIDFLRQYPPELREQIEALLTSSLGLLDKSIYGYIDRINSVLDDKIKKLTCFTQAVVSAPADSVRDFVDMIKQSKDGPSGKLRAKLVELLDDFTPSTPSYSYNDRYADFSTKISVALCKYEFSDNQVVNLTNMLTQVTNRYRLWLTIYQTCKDAIDCLDAQLKQLNDEIAAADKRDVDKSNAINIKNELVLHKPIVTKSTFFHKSEFNPKDFEDAIGVAYTTRVAIKLAELSRVREDIIALNDINTKSRMLILDANNWISHNPPNNPNYRIIAQNYFQGTKNAMEGLAGDLFSAEAPTSDAAMLKKQLAQALTMFNGSIISNISLTFQGQPAQGIPLPMIQSIPILGTSSPDAVKLLPGGVIVPASGGVILNDVKTLPGGVIVPIQR